MTHISLYARVPATLMLSWFVLSDDHPASIQPVAPNSRTFVIHNLDWSDASEPSSKQMLAKSAHSGLTINDRIAVKRAA